MGLFDMQQEFEFRVGPHSSGELAVLSFEAEEQMSRLFSLEVTVIADPDLTVNGPSLIGEKASLMIQSDGGTSRYFHGMVVHVKSWEQGRDADRYRHRFHIVPSLWKLGQMRTSRIFQEMSVPEIVGQLLQENDIVCRTILNAKYSKRVYCVQYDETNLEFASRLLAEEGIFYFFEHESDRHTLVLADSPSAYRPLPGDPAITFREPSQMSAETEQIEAFSSQVEVKPDSVELRDFDYFNPAYDLTLGCGALQQGGVGELKIYEFPGGYADLATGKAFARIRLEEQRVRAATANGTGYSRRFSAGSVFQLEEHPDDALNEEYLLISVSHRGSQQELLTNVGARTGEKRGKYQNDFVCVRSTVPFRPERTLRKPKIPGPQTATVVGPANEEIYCDNLGRVKVQFHWDRKGRRDENSSCWIRVSQAWAGQGWGALYLPRIGQEVVVEFLEGDPDRPLISGSVYNGLHPPPVQLPDDKTKSTLRSASSPGSDGSNELRFEDLKGSEEIYLHAEKDLNVVVENDKSQHVGGNEKLVVDLNRTRKIGGNQTLQVGKDDTSRIDGNQSIQVGSNRSTTVGGNHTETVGGDQTTTIGASQAITVGMGATEAVGLAKALNVGGAYTITVGGAMNELVGGVKAEEVIGAKVEVTGAAKSESVAGTRTMHVGGNLSEKIGQERSLKVGKDLIFNVGGQMTHTVTDSYTLKTAQELIISADDRFILKVGSATIEVKSNGEVAIKGAQISVNASGDITFKGSKISEN